jgi:hypothetical protein
MAEPVHFVDELQPLQIHGMKNNCDPYVRLNLPWARSADASRYCDLQEATFLEFVSLGKN